MSAERVTVLDLMAQASASTPDSGAAKGTGPRRPPPVNEGLEERIERLTEELDAIPDPRSRDTAEQLLAAVLELHGEGLTKVLDLVDEDTAKRLADDPTVASVLLIHDLYPVPLDERVAEALDSVRPYMESHGGDVELLGIEDGIVRLRLQGSCKGCAASSATLELAIEQALRAAAPDLLGMDVEGMEDEPTHGPPDIGGIPLPLAANGNGASAPSVPELSGWLDVEGVAGLAEGETTTVEVAGVEVLVANVNGTLLAYRDTCAACTSSLAGAGLAEGVLTCPACSARFDLPRAGRGVDVDDLQLAPVPLLREGAERVRVALAS